MVEVKENSDGSFDIFWNENDPVESQMNNWSEEDFINAIKGQLDGKNRSSRDD